MNGHGQRQSTRKTLLKIVTLILAIVLLFSTAMFLFSLVERYHGQYPEHALPDDGTLSYNGTDYTLRDGIETLLILGLDTSDDTGLESYNNNKQADFLLLLVMDTVNGTCKGIHINRDTITDMNVLGVSGDRIDTVRQQIALSHTYGNGREVSCRNTADAVSGLLGGIKVDHYLSVTMDAVPVFNDLAGGVTLEVLDDLTALDPAMKQGETITLTGEQALTYVRARKGLEDPTNSHRMIRQKQYLEALYRRSRVCMQEQEDFISKAALAVTDYLVSDCSGNKLESLMARFAEQPLSTVSIDGESVVGEEFMEFYPDNDSLLQVVIACFYEPAA
ncbi:MAG: LCP family protein [Clostridia bacterium]|nr:LCP family protein [Clostridia bacterium]